MAKSSFSQTLSQTQIIVRPYDYLTSEAYLLMSTEALGVFVRLLPYAVSAGGLPIGVVGSPKRFQILARFAHTHPRTIKRLWPEISPLFKEDEPGRLSLRSNLDWLKVQRISADRQSLRHLLDRLVAYWGNACVYCKQEAAELQIEHIVPVVRGGSDDLTNLTLACQPCNLKKRTQTAAEFGFPHIHDLAARIQ